MASTINNAAAGPTPLEKEQFFGIAEKEMEYRVEMFNKLSNTCFNKCVDRNRYKEGELNLGEISCVDRCANKYYQVTSLIGQLLAVSTGQPNAF